MRKYEVTVRRWVASIEVATEEVYAHSENEALDEFYEIAEFQKVKTIDVEPQETDISEIWDD